MSNDSQLRFQRFGKYLLLDHIVDGGMAKIWRARYLGEQANKIVAIKMIQAQYSEDQGFRQMFEDELKLAFGLIHPNIAQTYDYGVVDNQLFTAMEYVDGANLKQYMDRLKKRNFVFPIEISSHIITQTCQALHYAHTFTDKLTGQSLNIVHRDISPHNIMLTFDGSVKVIDFGIAKAETNSEATQAGTIKGKLAYLAPEYLEGLELDCRYDVFAVGITFWELLCNRRLFRAKNDLAVLKKIQNCEVAPPSSINPNVPPELDAIVLKALSKNRDDRFENMDKFNRAVMKFLYSKYPDFNPTDLAYFAGELFKEDILADRKKLVSYGKIDIAQYLKEMKENGNGPSLQLTQAKENAAQARKKRVELDFSEEDDNNQAIGFEAQTIATATKHSIASSARKTSRVDRTRTSINRTRPRARKTNERKNQIQQQSSGGKNRFFLAIAACLAIFVAYKSGYLNKFIGDYKELGSGKVNTKQETALIYLDGFKPLMRVYVDNKEIDYSDFSGLKVPVGVDFKLLVEQSGKVPYETTLKVSKLDVGKTIHIPELRAGEYGILTTSRNFPTGSKILMSVKGKKIERQLPVENMRMPAGSYEAFIIDPILKTKKRINFKIEPSKKLFLRN